MNGNYILIFDKRFEISNKYKKIMTHNHCAQVEIVSQENDFFEALNAKEPDIILISESVSANFSEICKQIRSQKLKFRPVIILLSKSAFAEDKTNALNAGADDLERTYRIRRIFSTN